MHCKYCNHSKTHKRGKTTRGNKKYQRYICHKCNKSFSELSGTIYQNRHLTPQNIDLILNSRNRGMSIKKIAKLIGVCTKTVTNLIGDNHQDSE
jgi:transposase-like protein